MNVKINVGTGSVLMSQPELSLFVIHNRKNTRGQLSALEGTPV